MANAELIRLALCPSMAWRNGGGSMRLVATHPLDGGADDFDWRISVAEVAKDSPFSAFPGYDRCIALISGNGMTLESGDLDLNHRLDNPMQPFYFAGETRIHARLIDGPMQNLSVLARRGSHWITLTPLASPTRLQLAARKAPLFIQCLSGELQIDLHDHESIHLLSGELVLWRSDSPDMHLISHSDKTKALMVDLGTQST